MKIEFKNDEIILTKEPSLLDNLIMDFSEILSSNNIKHVLFGRFISNIFGKNGMLEDMDLLIQNISFEKFLKLWLEIENTYECKNTNDPIDAYNAYLRNYHHVIIIQKGHQIPQFKIKIVKNDIDRHTLKYRKKVMLGDRNLFISPLEMQIPFHLFLGSEKDIEEARFLYNLASEKLNMTMMQRFLIELKIPKESAEKYLGDL